EGGQHGEQHHRELPMLDGELGELHGRTATAAPSSRYAAPSVTTAATPSRPLAIATCSPARNAMRTARRSARRPSGASDYTVALTPSASSSDSIGTSISGRAAAGLISSRPMSPLASADAVGTVTSTR